MTPDGSWADLAVTYFAPACASTLTPYFVAHGFTGISSDTPPVTAVTYRRGPIFITVQYWVEDAPKFTPMIGIGTYWSRWVRIVQHELGLWSVIPENSVASSLLNSSFSSESECLRLLMQLRDEVIDGYARPLWENPGRLEALATTFEAELRAQRENEEFARRKRQAELAFKAGDYDKAQALYSAIGTSRLSRVEQKRLEIARKGQRPNRARE